MIWKHPPIYGGTNKCSHDRTINIKKSIVMETMDMAMDDGVDDSASTANKKSPARNGRKHSLTWMPPSSLTNHPSFTLNDNGELILGQNIVDDGEDVSWL